MKKICCIFFLATLALRFADAGDKPQTAENKAQPATEPAPIELKNKSSFVMEESGRNPFWPIGWKPAPKKSTGPEQAGPEIRETAFVVSSITLGTGTGNSFAIINGKVMTEGQVFGLQMGAQTYQLSVKAIQDGQVVLARRDQEIVVPLRRK